MARGSGGAIAGNMTPWGFYSDQHSIIMIIKSVLVLADVGLPGTQGLDAPRQSAAHLQPALVGLAALALAVVAFLIFDLWRQKRTERREREKLERFRQKRREQSAPSVSSGGPGDPQG
jgi:hypothetical protein